MLFTLCSTRTSERPMQFPSHLAAAFLTASSMLGLPVGMNKRVAARESPRTTSGPFSYVLSERNTLASVMTADSLYLELEQEHNARAQRITKHFFIMLHILINHDNILNADKQDFPLLYTAAQQRTRLNRIETKSLSIPPLHWQHRHSEPHPEPRHLPQPHTHRHGEHSNRHVVPLRPCP